MQSPLYKIRARFRYKWFQTHGLEKHKKDFTRLGRSRLDLPSSLGSTCHNIALECRPQVFQPGQQCFRNDFGEMVKPLHSSRLPSWQSLQACMSRLLSEKEYDCDDEEEDLADVPDRPRDLHYLRGMYRPFLRCSQNHQHIHHHRCIVAMLNDGSTFNMICFRLPRIISRKAVVFIFWIMNTIISTLFISSTDLPRNEVLAGVPFDKKSLESLSFVSFFWSSLPTERCPTTGGHCQLHISNIIHSTQQWLYDGAYPHP